MLTQAAACIVQDVATCIIVCSLLQVQRLAVVLAVVRRQEHCNTSAAMMQTNVRQSCGPKVRHVTAQAVHTGLVHRLTVLHSSSFAVNWPREMHIPNIKVAIMPGAAILHDNRV